MEIEMQPVDSSNVEAIGHDEPSQVLAVKFKNGAVYHYHDVPRGTFEALKGAESVGSHLHSHIKPHHPVKKI